ncbi:hypothetical protein Tco_0951553 [Tanacetum coccineum]|uniref:Uncharacterized protein n=1 Tax=Tanacetum coccineum TaxID=301880 RepID=A0ABQ5DX97_9ASTR
MFTTRNTLIVDHYIKFDKTRNDSDHNIQTSHHNDKRCLLKMSLQASFLKDKRRQIMTPRQNVVPTVETTYSSQQGLEFLFSHLLEEYYNPTHGHAEDNNNDQAPNASFQEAKFINPFCTRVQEIELVRGNPTMPFPNKTIALPQIRHVYFALIVIMLRTEDIKRQWLILHGIEAMQDELHQFDRLKVWELVDKPFLVQMIHKSKVDYGITKKIISTFPLGTVRFSCAHASHTSFFHLSDWTETAFLNGPTEGGGKLQAS